MDNQVFDHLAVSMATAQSRRHLLRRFVAGAIGLLAAGRAATKTAAQSCAGIQESCSEVDCCFGYGCNENSICIASAECSDFGQGCLTDEQCCGDLVCAADGKCAEEMCAGIQEACVERDCCFGYGCNENSICIAAAECAGLDQGCLVNEHCCDDLICTADGRCTALTLPSTGAGYHPNSSTGQQISVAAAATAAAMMIAGMRLRDRSMEVRPLEVAPTLVQFSQDPPEAYVDVNWNDLT